MKTATVYLNGLAQPPRLARKWTAAFVLALSSVFVQGTVDERSQFILDDLTSVPVPSPGGSGKLPYGHAIARLAETGGQDAAALDYLASTGYGGEIFFNSIMQVRALYLAGDNLTSAQAAAVRSIATDSGNNWANTGTENHRKMTWSSGYLLAQFFPDALWRWNSETVDSPTLMSRLRARLVEVGRNEYRAGYSEFLSPNYEIYHVAPMLNLYDFAEDPEMKAVAEANLLYHFGLMALGSYKEVVLPPWSRYAGDQDSNITGAHIQWLPWLFWGHGNVTDDRTIDASSPIVFFATSDWRPPETFDRIAQRVVEFPYTARMQQTHWQWNPERYVMRATYQDALYAVSSGVVRHLPGAFQLDDAQFMIAWDGSAAIRQITAFHPYWRSASIGEDYWLYPTSPFMQTGHHEDTAIMLFDISAEDPWAGVGQWASERAGDMIPLAQARFPSFMTYATGNDNWVFLSDGPVYIGIKILKDGWVRDRRSVTGFNILKSRGTVGQRWQSGFIFEVGTEDEFGSFEAFQTALEGTTVEVDWDLMTASYTNTAGDVLNLQYNTSLDNIPNHTVPDFSVNGTALAYDETWPVMESPWTRLVDQVLVIENADESRLVSDWSAPVPAISVQTGGEEAPAITSEPQDITVTEGETAVFSVGATGTEPLAYQWSFGDTVIDSATDATLTIIGVTPADAGAYSVTVSNGFGSASSASANLTVDPADPDSWAGYPIEDSGLVDTGDRFGWIYPLGDWVYFYDLERYVYLPESAVSAVGSWIFIDNQQP